MAVITVEIPPGLFMNGTPYEAKGRYSDGNLIRWHNTALTSIGGWAALATYQGIPVPPLTGDPANSIARDGFSWVDNQGTRRYIFGSNDKVMLLDATETLTDITPANFVGYPAQPTVDIGYGRWLYGRSFYNTPRPVDPDSVARLWRWSFDTWGENVLMGAGDPTYRGGLYYFDINAATAISSASPVPGQQALPATPIPNAPQDHNGFVVTDQRVVMTIGSSAESRLVQWSDREDFNEWAPAVDNWAGSQFIQGTGRLLSINKVLNQVLILSESDAHVARFVGAPYIYGFDRVGDRCGPWNGSCVHVTDNFAMWPSRRQFWVYDGTLKTAPCEVMTFLDNDLSRSMLAKAFSLGVPQFSEIWWFYQSKGGVEVDSYVSYDYEEGHWQRGRLSRSCGVSGEVYVNPIMVDAATQIIIQHELPDVQVEGAFATTGPIELGQGESNMAVRYIYPDTSSFGDVSYTLTAKQMPTGDEYTVGPYAYNNPIATRIMGREVLMRIDGGNVKWQVGSKTRFDVAPMETGRR